MSIVDSIPENKPVFECEKHGTVEARYMKMWNDKFMESTSCPECIAEAKREESRIQREKDEAQRLYFINLEKERSGVSKRNLDVTLDSFTTSNDKQVTTKKKAKTWLDKFISNQKNTPSMIITGSVGTGKTLLASALINELVRVNNDPELRELRGRNGHYKLSKLVDIVRSLKETWRRDSEKTETQLIKQLAGYDLLIIDEVGMGFDSDTEKMFIFDVIDGRYQNMLPTILISNLNTEGIKNSIGERALDRLRDGGGVLLGCDWESFRK